MDITEKTLISDWALENYSDEFKKKVLSEIDVNADSYYRKRKNECCLEVYDYEKVPEWKERMERLFAENAAMQKAERVMIAAAFGEKEKRLERVNEAGTEYQSLPEFVYIF